MKTLSDVLHDADPTGDESRTAQARALTRSAVLDAPQTRIHDIRALSRRRTMAIAAAFGALFIAGAMFGWRHISVDAVAAVRFEVRLKGTTEVIVRNSDIARAEVASAAQEGRFDINLTFTREGTKKLRDATARNVGRTLEILIDGTVVMSPTIRSAIPALSGQAQITGAYTRAEADRIVSGIIGQ